MLSSDKIIRQNNSNNSNNNNIRKITINREKTIILSKNNLLKTQFIIEERIVVYQSATNYNILPSFHPSILPSFHPSIPDMPTLPFWVGVSRFKSNFSPPVCFFFYYIISHFSYKQETHCMRLDISEC